jgi:hypothetical protein
MKYFLLLAFTSISLLVCAENSNDSTLQWSRAKTILDSTENLESKNKANEFTGNIEEDLSGATGFGELEKDVYVKILSPKTRQSVSIGSPAIKAINERLKEINNSRRGKDVATGKDKDGPVIFAFFSFDFKAYLKSDIDFAPHKHTDDNATLDKYFNEDQKANILNFDRAWADGIGALNEAMKEAHYSKRIIYVYSGYNYYSPNTLKSHFYVAEEIYIESDPEVDGNGKTIKSKFEKVKSSIILKAKPSAASFGKSQGAHIRQVIENLNSAIEAVYENESTSDKGIVNCGNTSGTWPVSNDKYKAALNSIASLWNNSDKTFQLESKYVLIDQPENFKLLPYKGDASNQILTDKVFVQEILPDLHFLYKWILLYHLTNG